MHWKRRFAIGALVVLAIGTAIGISQDPMLAFIAYIDDGSGNAIAWNAIGTGAPPPYPLRSVKIYCQSGSTTALCKPSSGSGITTLASSGGTIAVTNPSGPSTNVEVNLAHVNSWTARQTLVIDGQAWSAQSPPGDSFVAMFTPSFGDPMMYVGGVDGNAKVMAQARAASVAGFYAGGAANSFTAPIRVAVPGTAAQVMSDSVASDTLVNAPSGSTTRIGSGTGASLLQVGLQVGFTCVTLTGATPVIGNGPCYTMTLGAATTPTLTTPIAGQHTILQVCQDATGGRAYTPPTGMHGAITGVAIAGMAVSTCAQQTFESLNGSTLVAENTGVTGVAP